jgi:hypothetical protein
VTGKEIIDPATVDIRWRRWRAKLSQLSGPR